MASLVELIAKKRDGGEHSADEVRSLIDGLSSGKLADYQMSAWLMAVYWRGMTDAETVALTEAMLHSGDVLDLSSVAGVKVDKHSTGGVGDKVSICLAPLVASCGVKVPMVSGRGLGHTGGTLDKLEAIPGFRVDLPVERFVELVDTVGTCMIGQTKEIAPADKRIYALRDVTATVECIPLIVASILSKKLAEGIDALVLDVKVGRGAFMKSESDARALATALVNVGTKAGKDVTALLTDMNQPLGNTIGNANETREAIQLLHGEAPADLLECTLQLGAEMLVAGKVATDRKDAESKLSAAIADGRALATMTAMVEAQGGDPSVVADPSKLPQAPVTVEILAQAAGHISGIDSLALGLSAVSLGAGRTRTDQAVDHAVGIDLCVKRGMAIEVGQPLCRLSVRHQEAAEAVRLRVQKAFEIAPGAPSTLAPPLIIDRITAPRP